ncbi:hypothetical protein EDB19DRAFT_1720654 [Suillus lakei]|nr:hypothetical protein EDB19DRAFT_1720654 [Suillus lakei]
MTSYSSLHNGSASTSAILNQSHFPSFSVPQLAPIFASSSTSNPTNGLRAFKAPAHKHAHHLHSIPPREKSTRTLIIDHMLWVHGRTRFTQARAELGMTDRTGGPSSPNYRHPREGGPNHPHNEDEDNRRQKQDLTLARSLRLRAIGLEKVVTSMLDQPPPVHPILDDDLNTPPTSPQRPESHQSPQRPTSHHPHTLPNGVRLRLALGTVINDLFARQAPTPPYRHHHHPPPIIVPSNGSDQASSNGLSPGSSPAMQKASPVSGRGSSMSSAPGATGSLPPSVVLLSQVVRLPALPQTSLLPRGDFRAPPSPMQAPQMVQSRNRRPKFMPSSRVCALYMQGADPSTANSPPGLRCPRHLHTGCEICVEAKHSVKAPGGSGRTRPPSAAMVSRNFGDWEGGLGGTGGSMGGSGGGIAGWQDGPGVGSGLAQPGVNGSALRRMSKWFMADSEGEQSGSGAGNTRLSELIPRFLRLSALVATELGEELGDDEYEGDWQRGAEMPTSPRPSSRRSQTMEAPPAPPLRPSREWYMLLAGLLARATLEGYLTGGWWGLDAVECLLSVGLGITDDGFGRLGQVDSSDDADFAFEWFEPDDLPSLKEATRIMFPALRAARNGTPIRREGAEAEFEAEMDERLRRFYTIPSLTPDLSTHMEDLAWHYPAEPVERAALRFCEAIAKWRGKPELETVRLLSRISDTAADIV